MCYKAHDSSIFNKFVARGNKTVTP